MFKYNGLAARQEAEVADVRSFTCAGNQQTTSFYRAALCCL